MSAFSEIFMVEKHVGIEWVAVFPPYAHLRDAQIEAAFIENKGGKARIVTYKREG